MCSFRSAALLGVCLCLLGPLAASGRGAASPPGPIRALAGRNDMLFAATPQGLVTWQLPQGTARLTTTRHGLPSDDVLGVHLHASRDELLLRTSRGLARGWLGGFWDTLPAVPEAATALCALPTNEGWFVGGQRGWLLAWQRDDIETLQLPTQADVVGLALAPSWAARLQGDAGGIHAHSPLRKTASRFRPGLLVATDDDGLWLLRSLRPPRWLQLGRRDGLPDDHLLHVVLDDSAQAWVATRAGIARITPELQLHTWPQAPLLSQRGLSMQAGPSTFVYVGWWGGLFRVVTRPYDDPEVASPARWVPVRLPGPATSVRVRMPSGAVPRAGSGVVAERPPEVEAPLVEELPGIHDPIVSMAWADALWWTSGDSVTSWLGVVLHPPSFPVHPHRQVAQPEFSSSGPGTGSRFQDNATGPLDQDASTAARPGRCLVGGSSGPWESPDPGWRWTPLRPGASEVRSTSAAAGTPVQGGSFRCIVAPRPGRVLRIRDVSAPGLRVFDVRGRRCGVWRETTPGVYERDGTLGNRILDPGLYFGITTGTQPQRIRVLVPR